MSHVTTQHNDSSESVFSTPIAEKRVVREIHGATVEIVDSFPALLSNTSPENKTTDHELDDKRFTSVIVGFPPGMETPMHRTKTVNIGIVLEGTVELHLDSGEMRVLQKGDSYTQKATMHKWKNVGENWARLATFTLPWPIESNGEEN